MAMVSDPKGLTATYRRRVPTMTPGGAGIESGTKKSGASSRLGSTRYFSKSRTPCS